MVRRRDILCGELPDAVVGIGAGCDRDAVVRSAEPFGENAVVYDDPEALVSDLASGRIDAAVRGNMSSSVLLPKLKEALGLTELERVVILEPQGGRMFCLAPVGIDEGWTLDQKHRLVIGSLSLLKRLGMGSKVAVMSGGRKDDGGRNGVVDDTLKQAIELTKMLNGEGIEAYDAQILIEDAVKEADLVIAPDGVSGNLIFRTMHFIGGAHALGAPVINTDRVFVDTSRAKSDYRDSIALAMKLTERVI